MRIREEVGCKGREIKYDVLTMCLKCSCDQILDLFFFFVVVVFFVFVFFTFSCTIGLSHSAKFQSITNVRSHCILTFNSENLRPPLITLVPRLRCEWEKVASIPHGLKFT